jgi:CrcB protein
MSVGAWCLAALLGGCGALLRFAVDGAISRRVSADFPYGTLVVNLSGSLLLGFTVGLALRGDQQTLIGSAAIGAYTTFSTWMFETQRLTEEGETARATGNVIISLALGLLAAVAGRAIGAHL